MKYAAFVVLILVIIIALAIFFHQEYVSDINSLVTSIGWNDIAQNPLVIAVGIIASIITIYYSPLWPRKKTEGNSVSPKTHHRNRMIEQVKNTWIKSFLLKSLHNVMLIDLGLEERRNEIDLNNNLAVRQPDCELRNLPSSARIIDIYDELDKSFLILGDPGSGKTTLLLQLTEKLLARAEMDDSLQIPVVFNLFLT
jgi:hypothetical protein